MANAVNWFEIPVSDMDRAKKFYETVLGYELALNSMGPMHMAWFPMEQGGTGSTGSLIKAEGYVPSETGSVVYFSVEDIEATLAKVNENGGETVNPKTSIGEYGFVAHFKDTEGNKVALHSQN
jgi:predicted enzyme related to lactoylglutathione lyase